jgi:pimeloyl-ACP methyl ester carboxylesterase
MMMTTAMTNPMVPNDNWKTHMSSSEITSSTTTTEAMESNTSAEYQPVRHPEEPNLFCIPQELQTSYTPLPTLVRIVLGIMTSYIMTTRSFLLQTAIETVRVTSQIGFTWRLPIRLRQRLIQNNPWVKKHIVLELLKVGIQSFVFYTIASTVLQDVFLPNYRPSRITTSELLSKYNMLPSVYSNYRTLRSNNNNSSNNDPYNQQKIHYLNVTTGHDKTKQKDNIAQTIIPLDVIYVNHGFGASSLSWLPILPGMILPPPLPPQFLNATTSITTVRNAFTTTILGHDAPGFGFTDRFSLQQHKDDDYRRYYYSIANSATIGTRIVQEHFQNKQQHNNATILLMGHSLGALTTLRMALQQYNDNNNSKMHHQYHIILVAPAIGFRNTKKISTIKKLQTPEKQSMMRIRSILQRRIQRPIQSVGTALAGYGLRRLVGRTNFWRNGLRTVWVHPKHIRDCDVVRYAWPSIVQHWERGLLQFAAAQISSSSTTQQASVDAINDKELVQAVLNLPNVASFNVIVGSKDRIIPEKFVRKFFQKHFPSVPLTVLDGLGHNPHEEDPDLFVSTVQSLLASTNDV